MKVFIDYVADKFGLPVALMIGMAWGLAEGGKWMGNNVVKPTVDTHLNLIESMQDQEIEQTKVLSKIQTQQEAQTRLLEQLLKGKLPRNIGDQGE